MVTGGVEQLDREIAERARRTAENGAHLAWEHGLQASAEPTELDRVASVVPPEETTGKPGCSGIPGALK